MTQRHDRPLVGLAVRLEPHDHPRPLDALLGGTLSTFFRITRGRGREQRGRRHSADARREQRTYTQDRLIATSFMPDDLSNTLPPNRQTGCSGCTALGARALPHITPAAGVSRLGRDWKGQPVRANRVGFALAECGGVPGVAGRP